MICFIMNCPVLLLQVPKSQPITLVKGAEDIKHYDEARTCVEELALYLKPLTNTRGLKKRLYSILVLEVLCLID